MIDPLTGNVIVFNGEIYNFQSLRQDCEKNGDRFTSHSDTEVILALYRRYQHDCLKFLRGMFAIAIWDERRQQLFIARDRIGKKPLNYALTATGLAFCSEIAPLAFHPAVDDSLDVEALEFYLQLHFIPAPHTIYRGIRKLPPAHYAIIDREGMKLQQYWEVDYRRKIQISEADALEGLEDKLTEAVRLRMIADVPLGALLSGGVDSSVVVALMAKLSGEPVRTFSIGFDEAAFNELPWAQVAADRCQTAHHPEIVKGDVEHILPALARHYGEPYADSSAIPSFYVSAAARRHVTVALNGDGGDELLGGYPRYQLPQYALTSAGIAGGIVSARQIAELGTRLLGAKSITMRVARRALMRLVAPEIQSILMFDAAWNDRQRAELLPQSDKYLLRDWRTEWFTRAFAKAENPIDRMLWLDNHIYLPGDLMVKMDIASMHCGLETRSPLLDHELIEFCAALPVQYKVQGGEGKYLLKKLAERYFASPFVYRRKMGFGIPLASWLRGPLSDVLQDTLRDSRLMAPLEQAVINRTLSEFRNGNSAHESRLWSLLMFGTWRQHHADLHSRILARPSI